jgi:hypothetical protein
MILIHSFFINIIANDVEIKKLKHNALVGVIIRI